MINFNKASAKHNDPEKEARLAGIRLISDWVENELPEDEQDTTSVMVNQIECAEEGCPPVECVIALLRKPKLVFKVLCTSIQFLLLSKIRELFGVSNADITYFWDVLERVLSPTTIK